MPHKINVPVTSIHAAITRLQQLRYNSLVSKETSKRLAQIYTALKKEMTEREKRGIVGTNSHVHKQLHPEK